MFVPSNAPDWARDPERLWNAVEVSETRINSRIARELEVALPAGLHADQRSALASDLAGLLVERYEVAVLAALHAPDANGDQRNFHVHLLFTTRRIGRDGFGPKVRELDDRKTGPQEVETLREQVAAITNQHLTLAGLSERVDHRRLDQQARDAERRGDYATAASLIRGSTVHEGKAATAARRRGEEPELANRNECIRQSNIDVWTDLVTRMGGEGRLLSTPSRSDQKQASADRVRVAPRTSHPSVHAISASAKRVRSAGASLSRIPIDAGRGRARLERAQGRQAEVINQQAGVAEETLKAEADTARSYRRDLEHALRQTALTTDHPIHAYAQVRRFSSADVEALAQHCHADRRCASLLREGVHIHRRWEQAKTRPLRRRNEHGKTMVQTVEAQRALEDVERVPQPPAWRPKSRREWAELRRRQRALLEHAQHTERGAARAAGETAMRRYTHDEAAAHKAVREFESKRRERYPVPSDRRVAAPRLKPTHATSNADTPGLVLRPRPDAAERVRRPRP